jgi:hypothetical protein
VRTVSLLSGAVLSAAVLTACDSEVTEPPFLPDTSHTPTEEATSTPEPTPAAVLTPSPTLEPTDLEGFREFAPHVEAAVQARDVDFFMNVANISSVTCPEGLEPRCEGQPSGAVVEGIRIGLWRGGALLSIVDDFRASLEQYLASLTDPTLYAIAARDRYVGGLIGGPSVFAVVASADDLQTTTRVFEFVEEDGSWRMPTVIHVTNSAEEWLSGKCSDCYDRWERWEDTP